MDRQWSVTARSCRNAVFSNRGSHKFLTTPPTEVAAYVNAVSLQADGVQRSQLPVTSPRLLVPGSDGAGRASRSSGTMRHCLAVLLVLGVVCPVALSAQTATVRGRVLHVETGRPITGRRWSSTLTSPRCRPHSSAWSPRPTRTPHATSRWPSSRSAALRGSVASSRGPSCCGRCWPSEWRALNARSERLERRRPLRRRGRQRHSRGALGADHDPSASEEA
jgi:hypothetical protein